jgi:exosortase K
MLVKLNTTKIDWNRIAQLAAILFLAFASKSYYSVASANDLRWILAPTAWLVSFVTRMDFAFEQYGGYLSSDRTFLIAPACSGVNFLIISFLVLTLGKLWRNRPHAFRWLFFPTALIAAYIVTLVAHTARISAAILLRPCMSDLTRIDPVEIHRLEGRVIYFGFLLLLFLVTEKMDRSTSIGFTVRSNILKGLPVLLAVYYGVTLGVPLLNGAYHEAGFWKHSLFVIAVPIALTLPLVAWLTDHEKTGRLKPPCEV